MRSLPEEFDAEQLPELLSDSWGFDVVAVDYAPVGAGSYHWIVEDAEGVRRFVTVDDLDRKPWLGDDRETAFDGLNRAFSAALALHEHGLALVVSPIPTHCGEALVRCGPRYTIALFPFLIGQTGAHGRYVGGAASVAAMLAELHRSTAVVASISRAIDLGVPGRSSLDAALGELGEPWSGGPLSEAARSALAERALEVTELLALSDRLTDRVERSRAAWVVTHGEPHAANVMRSGDNHVLVDWDTVAIASPERDLWMLVGEHPDAIATYANLTGYEPDPLVAEFFRLRWDLSDIAAYIDELRSPHQLTDDAERALRVLAAYGGTRHKYAPLLDG